MQRADLERSSAIAGYINLPASPHDRQMPRDALRRERAYTATPCRGPPSERPPNSRASDSSRDRKFVDHRSILIQRANSYRRNRTGKLNVNRRLSNARVHHFINIRKLRAPVVEFHLVAVLHVSGGHRLHCVGLPQRAGNTYRCHDESIIVSVYQRWGKRVRTGPNTFSRKIKPVFLKRSTGNIGILHTTTKQRPVSSGSHACRHV